MNYIARCNRSDTSPLLQVDVFVNGQLVPFSMKIGEAGEAFFVFETEEEIPESLVTSPILEATKPGETNARTDEAGRFGAGPASPVVEEFTASSQEPEFLDLNAPGEAPPDAGTPSQAPNPDNVAEEPSLLSRTAELGKAMIGVARETQKAETDKLRDKSIIETLKEEGSGTHLRETASAAYEATQRAAGIRFPGMSEAGDEFLPKTEQVDGPDVKYAHGELSSPHVRKPCDSISLLRCGLRHGGLSWTHTWTRHFGYYSSIKFYPCQRLVSIRFQPRQNTRTFK